MSVRPDPNLSTEANRIGITRLESEAAWHDFRRLSQLLTTHLVTFLRGIHNQDPRNMGLAVSRLSANAITLYITRNCNVREVAAGLEMLDISSREERRVSFSIVVRDGALWVMDTDGVRSGSSFDEIHDALLAQICDWLRFPVPPHLLRNRLRVEQGPTP